MNAWMFDNPRRMRRCLIALAVVVMVLFLGTAAYRLTRLPTLQGPATASPTATVTPESTSTDLLAPSPGVLGPDPTPTYGSAAPIALEAVQAFLTSDHTKFASLAQQDAVEDVNEAPKPSGQISGRATIVLPGPTRQQIDVPTTEGDLLLDMVVVDGAWKVLAMRYDR